MPSYSYLSNDLDPLKGLTFSNVRRAEIGNWDADEGIIFEVEGEPAYALYHSQDCCENVWIAEIHGELEDLVGTPVEFVEVVSENMPEASECGAWTFYKLATVKGHVTIRFGGESNGYYSIDANLYQAT